MEPEANPRSEEKSGFATAFIAGVIIVAVCAAALVLITRLTRPHASNADQNLPFGPAERAYVPEIQFQGGEMSQSSNLLNQEFIYVAGTVTNAGNRTIRALDVVFEFRDPFNQLVLRDPQHLIDHTAESLKAGQSRDFQVTLGSHLPSEWNRQYPALRVTGVLLE
jgi:hypothetical protein